MQINTRLIWATDLENGTEGWRVKKFKWAQPTGEFGLTHDILEHHPQDKGYWYMEIFAFGAMQGFRGNSDFLYGGMKKSHKLIAIGKELGYEILHGIIRNKDLNYLQNLPKNKIHIGNSDLEIIAVTATAAMDREFKDNYPAKWQGLEISAMTDWVYKWLCAGYARSQYMIERSVYDGVTIYSTLLNHLKERLKDYEGYFELSVQYNIESCYCLIVPIIPSVSPYN